MISAARRYNIKTTLFNANKIKIGSTLRHDKNIWDEKYSGQGKKMYMPGDKAMWGTKSCDKKKNEGSDNKEKRCKVTNGKENLQRKLRCCDAKNGDVKSKLQQT